MISSLFPFSIEREEREEAANTIDCERDRVGLREGIKREREREKERESERGRKREEEREWMTH